MPEDGRVGIALRGVSKRFGTAAAVDDVTLEIGEGGSSRCSGRAAAARRRRSG